MPSHDTIEPDSVTQQDETQQQHTSAPRDDNGNDRRWRCAAKNGLSIWALGQLAYYVIAAFATGFTIPSYNPVKRIGTWVFNVFSRYDAAHFQAIAQHGYLSRGPDDVDVAFFPGYPLASRALANLLSSGEPTAIEFRVAMGLVTWVGSATAAVLIWKYIADLHGSRAAMIGTTAFILGPFSIFFVAPYSEGPFLALSLGAWLCATRRHWVWAGILCALAAYTRVNGLLLLVALIVMFLLQRRGDRPVAWRNALPMLLPIFSVASYFAWLRSTTGHADAWLRAQERGWHRTTEWPWETFIATVHRTSNPSLLRAQHLLAWLELLFAAVYVLVIIAIIRRHMWPEATFVGLTAATMLTSSFYQSVPRSIIVCFPIYLLFGDWWVTTKHRWARAPLALLCGALAFIEIAMYIRGPVAG